MKKEIKMNTLSFKGFVSLVNRFLNDSIFSDFGVQSSASS